MKQTNNFKKIRKRIMYTIITAVLLCATVFSMMVYIFYHSENEAFNTLHMETQQLKGEIELQLLSDRENLITMANFASKLYSDGESFNILLESFQKIGLIENIGILLPDNSFVTKIGTIDAGNIVSFTEEAKLGRHISGIVADITAPERKVIRTAVPVIANGETIAVLYGLIELDTLKEQYASKAAAYKARMLVFESDTGSYIIDTQNKNLGNITSLATTAFKNEFSYDRMISDITSEIHGYSSFLSATSGEYVYVHYTPLSINDWYILLSKPEEVVFAGATTTGYYMLLMLAIVVFILILYILLMLRSEAMLLKTSSYTSGIRKRLLELNRHEDSIYKSLSEITKFAGSRSAFFADTYGVYYNYVQPAFKQIEISGEDRIYLIDTLFSYGSKNKIDKSADNYAIKITIDKHLKNEFDEFYKFAKSHNIESINYAVVTSDNTTSLLGVINAKKKYVNSFLKDISVCCSMAIYNKKHLDKTETMALTDSLTGVANRMAYNRDIEKLTLSMPDKLACIYIDVNELHYFNNKHGHAAGDHMLQFIARELKNHFHDAPIYRMGGDEFLVFAENLEPDDVKNRMNLATREIEEMKYHISTGIAYGDKNSNIDKLLAEAEKIMYEEKAKYYQQKQHNSLFTIGDKSIEHITTGLNDLDDALSVMSLRYHGVFCVTLEDDTVRKILTPTYFSDFSKDDTPYTDIFTHYVHNMVMPDYRRALLNFLNYDALKKQLIEGTIPNITYLNTNGENIVLKVYPHSVQDKNRTDTIWTFEKED